MHLSSFRSSTPYKQACRVLSLDKKGSWPSSDFEAAQVAHASQLFL